MKDYNDIQLALYINKFYKEKLDIDSSDIDKTMRVFMYVQSEINKCLLFTRDNNSKLVLDELFNEIYNNINLFFLDEVMELIKIED